MTLQLTISPEQSNPSPYQARQPKAPDIVNNNFFSGFKDLADIINPLQHLPIVSTIYRELTGSTLSPGAKLAGDALYGGALGFLGSIANSIVQQETGKDIGATIYAAVTGKYDATKNLATPAPQIQQLS